jgi:hypothetical protein
VISEEALNLLLDLYDKRIMGLREVPGSHAALVDRLIDEKLVTLINEPPAYIRRIKISPKGIETIKEAFAIAAMSDCSERPDVPAAAVERALKYVTSELYRRLNEKGWGAFVSCHEIVGIIDEEFDELKEAVHDNVEVSAVLSELADIAVPAIFGIACLDEKVEILERGCDDTES